MAGMLQCYLGYRKDKFSVAIMTLGFTPKNH